MAPIADAIGDVGMSFARRRRGRRRVLTRNARTGLWSVRLEKVQRSQNVSSRRDEGAAVASAISGRHSYASGRAVGVAR